MNSCLGCKLTTKELETFEVYESRYFKVILDIEPLNPGHLLILPKTHKEFYINLNAAEIGELQAVIQEMQELLTQKLGYKDFTMWINQGSINDLNGHLHIHLIPRQKNDGLVFEGSQLKGQKLKQIFDVLTHK